MGIWFWFVLAVLGFVFITLVRKWHDYAILFTIAIGFAINANIFHALSAPIYWGSLIFSIDSILYTGFMFCVVICANEYGIRKAKILTSSAIAAILLSAVIEFLAKISTTSGFAPEYFTTMCGYVFSAVGTFLGVWLMLYVFEKLKAKNLNIYVNMIVCILIASIINSSVFYGFTLLINSIENFANIIVGSYIGKIFCIILCLLSYYVNTHYYIPNNLKEKYKPAKQPENIDQTTNQQ